MPRVYSQKANKDYPDQGIKKGDTYYRWCLRPGGPRGLSQHFKSSTYPKPWQLTNSPFLQQLYQLQERLGSLEFDDVEDFIGDIESLQGECQDSLDNMPEQLQEAPTGELLTERIEALDEWRNEIDSVNDNHDAEKEVDETDDEWANRCDTASAELQDCQCSL